MGRRKKHLQLSLQLARSARYEKDDHVHLHPPSCLMLMPKTLRNVTGMGLSITIPPQTVTRNLEMMLMNPRYSELEEEDLVQVLQAEIEALSQPSPYDETHVKRLGKGGTEPRPQIQWTL